MTTQLWLEQSKWLLARLSGANLGPDIAMMLFAVLWGTYRVLATLVTCHDATS